MEIDPKEGPLTLKRVRHTLDCADMDRDPGGLGVGDKDDVLCHVDIDLARLAIRREFFH